LAVVERFGTAHHGSTCRDFLSRGGVRVSLEVNMKAFSFPKALTLGCLLCLSVPVACGDDESNPKPTPSDAGAGGEVSGTGGVPSTTEGGAGGDGPMLSLPGTSTTSKTVTCGTTMCKSTATLLPTLFVDPCCTADDDCGVATQFLGLLQASFPADAQCQPKMQAGDLDAACPDSAEQMVTVPGVPSAVAVPGFAGCCRADTGTCGVVVDDITTPFGSFAKPQLGCVDSAPFFGQKAGAACGAAGGGSGGAGAGGGSGDGGAGALAGGAGGAPGGAGSVQ
jgi:hypothetical protein